VTYKNFQERNHLDGAIETYEFFQSLFDKHLDTLGEREKRVLRDAKESVEFFRRNISED